MTRTRRGSGRPGGRPLRPEAEVGIRAGRGRRFDSADGMFAELDGVRREPDGGDRG
jgi:hypothetical protein